MLTRASTDQIIQDSLGKFKSTLTETQRIRYEGKQLRDVQLRILAVQNHQERVKGLMNFVRVKHHIERFAEFDDVCRSTRIGGELATELSDYIWGPSEHILTVSTARQPSPIYFQQNSGLTFIDRPRRSRGLDNCPRFLFQVWGQNPKSLQIQGPYCGTPANDDMCRLHVS